MRNVSTRRWKTWLFASMLMLMAGCMGIQEIPYTRPDALPSNTALVYFYRPFNILNSAKSLDVVVNGEKTEVLYNKGFFPVEVAPGDTDIELKDMVLPYSVYGSLNLHVKPGRVYFVKYGPDKAIDKFKFRMMDPAVGEEEIRNCTWFKKTEG